MMETEPQIRQPPAYTDAELERLVDTYRKLELAARWRYWDAKGFEWCDVVQEVFSSVLAGTRGRRWDARKSPDPLRYLRKLLKGIGGGMKQTSARLGELTLADMEKLSCDPNEENEEAELRQLINRKQQEIIEAEPHLKQITEYWKKCAIEGKRKPTAEETAGALHMTADHVRYVLNKARRAWHAIRDGELKRLE